MAYTDGGAVKQETVRGAAGKCLALSHQLLAQMNQSFRRQPETEQKCEGRPPMPNVLDEVIDDLGTLAHTLEEANKLLSELVISKL